MCGTVLCPELLFSAISDSCQVCRLWVSFGVELKWIRIPLGRPVMMAGRRVGQSRLPIWMEPRDVLHRVVQESSLRVRVLVQLQSFSQGILSDLFDRGKTGHLQHGAFAWRRW